MRASQTLPFLCFDFVSPIYSLLLLELPFFRSIYQVTQLRMHLPSLSHPRSIWLNCSLVRRYPCMRGERAQRTFFRVRIYHHLNLALRCICPNMFEFHMYFQFYVTAVRL